jgi:AcrR family transcriptional regulator
MDKLIPNITPAKPAPNYHHGNLREALLAASVDTINQQGIQSLSLRKLAQLVGVSHTSCYHHFKDKDALLAAVAEQGFKQISEGLTAIMQNSETPLLDKLKLAVSNYVTFAVENATQYELMFGRGLWQGENHDPFQRVAKDSFRQYVHLFEQFQQQGILAPSENPLRISQLLWATLHGLAKLASDGIFSKKGDQAEIIQYALNRVESLLNIPKV